MRAILSEVDGTTKEVDIGNYKDYYKYIGCDSFDVVRLTWGDINVSIFIDDEGLFKKDNLGRKVFGYPEALFGNMVITGDVDDEGKTLPLPREITVETVRILIGDPIYIVGG